MTDYQVISAFLDDEPFDPATLRAALADEAGRDLLIDLLALRTIAQPDNSVVTLATTARQFPALVRLASVAAVLGLVLAAGYGYGKVASGDDQAPPVPTRVVKAGDWQAVSGGGVQ